MSLYVYSGDIIVKLRQEKIGLENALEAESESHVNRLSRELTALRLAQHQLQQQQQQQANGAAPSQPSSALSNADLASVSPEARVGLTTFMNGCNPADPSADVLLETLRRENEQLRNKLVDTERDFVRISRLNDIYREELIEHRRRVCFFRSHTNDSLADLLIAWDTYRYSDWYFI